MPEKALDSLDKKLVRLLTEDGRIPVGDMAVRLGVTAPTVRSRIKNLKKAGKLKITGLIDPFEHKDLIIALIGLNILSYGKLDEILEKLANLDYVTWVAVVTGRYDVIAEVVVNGGIEDLYRLTTDIIPQVGDVAQTETFVIMKSKRKWVCLPEGFQDW
ncbi:MAG: Lrp/AsnC family transcriptional regulator [Desulfobacteraceae bacterium]|nr:Lrp/AsnC family transcriptional regulator [Desulfobacteraceae bacterium]